VIVARTGDPILEPISVKIPEAVRLSGLSRSRIYELIKGGDIEFAKVGSSTLIIVESLRQFIERQRVPAGHGTNQLHSPELADYAAAATSDFRRSRSSG
jgi:excisionase family DNA binding protein